MQLVIRSMGLLLPLFAIACGGGSETTSNTSELDFTNQPIESVPAQSQARQTYQYVGAMNVSITPNSFQTWGEFTHLSENISKQSLLDYFESHLDTCYIEVSGNLPEFSIDADGLTGARIEYDYDFLPPTDNKAILGGTVRSINLDNSFARAIKTDVSVGQVTFVNSGGVIEILDGHYESWAGIDDISVPIGQRVSIGISGENFPAFSDIALTVISGQELSSEQQPASDRSNTYTWESEALNDPLSYVKLNLTDGNVFISCRLRNDGQFKIPGSFLNELRAFSESTYQDYLNGNFRSHLTQEQISIHDSGDALLVTNTTDERY